MVRFLSLRENFDVTVAVAGVVLGGVISSLNFIYSNEYLITIGPMLIIVCLAYILFRKKLVKLTAQPEANGKINKLAQIIFWLAFAISIFSLNAEVLHRPSVYFILISICAATIAFQILFTRGNNAIWIILLEIFLVSLSVRLSAFVVFPTLPGSDPWEHLNYIQDFVQTGNITSTRGDTYYLSYPITHLNTAIVNILTGLSLKLSMFVGIGLPMILSTVFVFLIGKSLVNTQVGLLATLLVNLSDTHLQFGVQLGSTSYGVAIFTIIAYLLIRQNTKYIRSFLGMIILFLMVMVITHTMSSFVLLAFMAFSLLGALIHKVIQRNNTGAFEGILLSVPLLLVFTLVLVWYWATADYVAGRTFLEAITKGLYNALIEQAGFLNRPEVTGSDYFSPILNIIGYLMMYLFGALGFLIWLSKEHQNKTRFILFIAITLITAFALIFPVFGIRNIVPSRWYAFIFSIISIPAAVAMITIAWQSGFRKINNAFVIAIVFVTSYFMITNNISNTDSPVYANHLNERLVYTASEINAGIWVVNEYEGRISTDLQYGNRVLETHLGIHNVNYNMLDEVIKSTYLVVWREVMAERPVQTPRGSLSVVGINYKHEMVETHNIIYSNPTSKVFNPKG